MSMTQDTAESTVYVVEFDQLDRADITAHRTIEGATACAVWHIEGCTDLSVERRAQLVQRIKVHNPRHYIAIEEDDSGDVEASAWLSLTETTLSA